MIRLETNNVNPGENVLLFPTFAKQDLVRQRWRFKITGAIYDPAEVRLRQRVLLKILRRLMRIPPESLDSPIFRDRIEAFVSAPERGKSVSIKIGDRLFHFSKKSKRNGIFVGAFSLQEEEIRELREDGAIVDDRLTFEIVTSENDERKFVGTLHLVPSTGLSIVSDIDDTIKMTEVTNRRAMLENTFFREFESIAGMSRLYQDWANSGALFHYVSSSPWQLFRPLTGLIESDQFPHGTIHLREFRLRDQMIRRVIRRPGKAKVIKDLLESFPNRDFIFVGDSGEKDPEIYLKLARKFKGQVKGAYIRSLEGKPLADERLKKILQKFPNGNFFRFSDAQELSEMTQDAFVKHQAV